MCFGWKSRVEKSVNHTDIKTEIYSACGMGRQSDTGISRGDSNHLKVIHKVPKQRTGKHEMKELQQTATFGAAHKLREVLM